MITQIRKPRARLIASVMLLFGIFTPVGSYASVSYTYDPVGRVTTALYDNGACVAYAYDASGNRTSQINTVSGTPGTPTWGSGVWGCFPWTPH
jgi:YD repeat-containing protein